MACRMEFGDRRLVLNEQQLRTLAQEEGDVVIVGFYFDCEHGLAGDVMLAGGRWLRGDGRIEAD